MMQKLFTVLLVGFASMVATPGSAQANPANCVPGNDPNDPCLQQSSNCVPGNDPCLQSYIQGREWVREHGTTVAICQEGLRVLRPPDRFAFGRGCADVIAERKAPPRTSAPAGPAGIGSDVIAEYK
jgi:hypothetical protein